MAVCVEAFIAASLQPRTLMEVFLLIVSRIDAPVLNNKLKLSFL